MVLFPKLTVTILSIEIFCRFISDCIIYPSMLSANYVTSITLNRGIFIYAAITLYYYEVTQFIDLFVI